MKTLNYWILLLMMAMPCIAFTSCGDDDDDSGNGTVKTCNVQADGKKTAFQYAYFWVDYDSFNKVYEHFFEFYNVDFKSLAMNPDKFRGKKMSFVTLVFSSPNKYDVNSLPTGEFTYNNYPNRNGQYFADCEINIDAGVDNNGNPFFGQFYTADWHSGYESSNLIINQISDGQYIIEVKNLNLVAGEPGEDGAEDNDRKTNGSFYFEGRFEDITSLMEEFD